MGSDSLWVALADSPEASSIVGCTMSYYIMEKCCSLNEYIEIRDRKKQVKPGKLEQSHLMQRESKHL